MEVRRIVSEKLRMGMFKEFTAYTPCSVGTSPTGLLTDGLLFLQGLCK